MDATDLVSPETGDPTDRPPDHASGGVDDAFADFFRSCWPRSYRVALGVTRDAAAAEDACQAAFARVYASWARISRVDHPEAYVRRMVINEVLGQHRRPWRRHERTQADPTADPRPTNGDLDALGQVVTGRDALWGAVAVLPPRQRAVVVLRYYEDLSETEIASVLGCSAGTVKSQASRALATLRRVAADDSTGDLR